MATATVSLPPASPGYVELTVRIAIPVQELSGNLIVPGQLSRAFTSWLGLLAALDSAVDELQRLPA